MEEAQKPGNPMLIVGIIVAILVVGGGIFLVSKKTTTKTSNPASNATQNSGTTGVGNPPAGTSLEEDNDSFMPADDSNSLNTTGSPTLGSETDANVQIVNVEAGSFYYKPNEIHAKVGTPVKIVMTAKDMMHDFTIDELNVKLPITKSGQTNTVEFTPTTKGTYTFYCSVGNHRAQGQVGKLIVE